MGALVKQPRGYLAYKKMHMTAVILFVFHFFGFLVDNHTYLTFFQYSFGGLHYSVIFQIFRFYCQLMVFPRNPGAKRIRRITDHMFRVCYPSFFIKNLEKPNLDIT